MRSAHLLAEIGEREGADKKADGEGHEWDVAHAESSGWNRVRPFEGPWARACDFMPQPYQRTEESLS